MTLPAAGPAFRPASPSGAAPAPRPAPRPRVGRFARPYMLGIGGCGMSALARLIQSEGVPVRGSDASVTAVTRGLEAHGVPVEPEPAGGALPEECDGLIASAAIKPDHPQMLEAVRRGLPVLTYAEALGAAMTTRTGIAVAGTHGKSTTAAMLGCALTDAGLDPSVIVGATCPQLAGGCLGEAEETAFAGFRLGAAEIPSGPLAGRPGLLCVEACEFNRSFHNYRPLIASVSSVEADHLDIYGSLDAVVEAFRQFALLVPPAERGGTLLIAHEGAHRREVTAGLECRVETIGYSPGADWVVHYDPSFRKATLTNRERGTAVRWTMNLPGEHNAMNAATACALGQIAGADAERLAASLGAFRGIHRRTQLLGERGGVRVYDDYGHHPTEVDKTLRALREHERPERRDGRLVCVFQPHQHSRTRFLLEEFATSFGQADVVIVPHIYFVRDSEAERAKVSAADLVDRLRRRGIRAMHLYPFEAIVEHLENVCRPGDVLVTMGAGPVNRIAEAYLALGGGAGAGGGA